MSRKLLGCIILSGAAGLAGTGSGCVEHRVKTDPIEIKPIHVTVDVNLRVDRELDRFFAFEDEVLEEVDLRR